MPKAAPKPCTQCGRLVHDGTARCDLHKVRPGSFADERRGNRHKRGYGTEWDKTREAIKVRAHGLCEPCLTVGIAHEGHECDHVISKAEWRRVHGSLAGVDAPTNLQWMNRDCHAAKTVIDRMRAAGASVAPWSPQPPTAVIARPAGSQPPARTAPGPTAASGSSMAPGVGQKSEGSPARTVRLVEVSTAAKTTPPGVQPEVTRG